MKKKIITILFMAFIFIVIIIQNNKSIAETTEITETKRYTIDLAWGSLSFIYDRGTWDTNKLEYCSQESSLFPANGTINGKPGWYGFNGEANKITIYNSSENDPITANVRVSKEVKDTEGNDIENQPTYTDNLEYSIYKDNSWNCFEGYEQGNNNNITNVIPAQENVSYYISINGELNTENESFNLPKNIGSVTIQITK